MWSRDVVASFLPHTARQRNASGVNESLAVAFSADVPVVAVAVVV